MNRFKGLAYCENCNYETDTMMENDIHLKLSREGGYIISDGEGGYFSKCPNCGEDYLVLRRE